MVRRFFVIVKLLLTSRERLGLDVEYTLRHTTTSYSTTLTRGRNLSDL